jgi:hypothetical protein
MIGLINNTPGTIRKKTLVAKFKALSRHLPGGTEENYETPRSEQPIFRPRFEPWPPEYEVRILITHCIAWYAGTERKFEYTDCSHW